MSPPNGGGPVAWMLLFQVEQPSFLEKLPDALVAGISAGAVYAMLALGFVIIFKATQVINFAHGALSATGAFMVAALATVLRFPGRFIEGAPKALQWGLSALLAVFAAALLGMAVERLFIRPMVGEPLFTIAIITLGIDVVMRTVTSDFIGTDIRPLGDPWGANSFEAGPFRVAHSEVAQIVVAVVCLLGVWIFFRTRFGVAMRATAYDQEAAMTQGIKVGRIFSVAWGIGAGLAAVAGLFASVFPRSTGVSSFTAFVALGVFPAIIIGGLDSVPGAVIGGFIIGLAEALAGSYLTFDFLGTGFAGVFPYIVMLVVLLVRPYGLFGTAEIRRV